MKNAVQKRLEYLVNQIDLHKYSIALAKEEIAEARKELKVLLKKGKS